MEKKKRRSWHNIFAMAFTFAMVMVFAGLVGKVDANAETTTCYMTIKVVDNNDEVIPHAIPFVDIWQPIGGKKYEKVRTITAQPDNKNPDGSYAIPIIWDSTIDGYEYGDPIYREGLYVATPGASADGYKTNQITNNMDPYNVGYTVDGFQLKDGNNMGEYCNESPYTLTLALYPDPDRLNDAKNGAIDRIRNYKSESDYDEDDWNITITPIINEYVELIQAVQLSSDLTIIAAENKIDGYETEAKEKLDDVATAQSKRNDKYKDYIVFNPTAESGKEPKSLAGSNGNYSIILSANDAGGQFNVSNASGIEWSAKIYSGSNNYGDIQYIQLTGGKFLNPQILPPGYSFNTNTTLEDCYVLFTPNGSTDRVKVTFDLTIVPELIKNISFDGPTVVPLERNENGKLNAIVNKVATSPSAGEYSVTVNYDSDRKDTENVEIICEDPNIAVVNDDGSITAKSTGQASFVAKAEDATGKIETRFTIEFVLSADELSAKIEAEQVDALINKLGKVSLDTERAINEARAAYNALSPNATYYVTKLDALESAEAELAALKAEKAAKDEKNAGEAAKVDALIAKLGEVTLSKESAIAEARKAYEALSPEAKAYVEKLDVLSAAETKLATLKSEAPAAAPTVKLSKITLKAKAGKGKVKLTWKKSSKAGGYIIYRATKKNGKYKQIKVIKSWKKTSFTDKKVKSKKTYYYKICPYKGTVNGPVSAAKKAKVK